MVAARASTMPSETGLSRRLQVRSAAAKMKKLNQGLPPLINWEYGEGMEGVFVRPSSDSALVLIVGRAVPWWGMVIARLDLRIHSIRLHDLRLSSLVSAYFGPSVPIRMVSKKSRADIGETRSALEVCKVVALERLPCSSESLWDMWSCPSVRLILVAHGKLSEPPNGWRLWIRSVSHQEVGGVTDLNIRVGVYYRGLYGQNVGGRPERSVCPRTKTRSNQPNRDLRSVLKVAVQGRSCKPPESGAGEFGKSHTVGTKVLEVRPGLIDSCGLLKVGLIAGRVRLPRVRAWFGGKIWVARSLTSSEIVSAWDVPEKLGMLAGSDEGRSALMSEPFTPLKIRQAVLEEVGTVFLELTAPSVKQAWTQRIQSGDLSPETQRPVGSVRGPLLQVTTPKEERDIFQDKTAVPRNVLLWPLSKEEKIAEMKGIVGDDLSVNVGHVGNSKATKDDKAPIKTEAWDKFLYLGLDEEIRKREWAVAARTIRPLIARHWRRLQLRKWIRFVREKAACCEVVSDLDRAAARDCLLRLQATTFWEWKSGSRPMFWNFPKDQQITMRDGIVLWMKGRMDPWLQSQRLPRDPKDIPKVVEKLCVARDKGYIDIGLVQSLISFFEVPKGLTDIRMVYDGTKSGLNEMLWAPWFPLPTVDSLLRSVEPGTWMSDNDVGEMFLNFILHESVQALCGVDLTLYFPDGVPEGTSVLWERWTRCAMGLRPSPYQACQGMMWALEVIFGDRRNAANVFRFDRVELNLPGSSDYNPARPWVYKVRKDGVIAADAHCYVDDVRATGPSEKDCWRASQRVSSVLASLGIQDATRKRRTGDLEAGAWKGAVVHTSNDKVTVLATQEKWDKLKECIDWMWVHHTDAGGMDHKILESKRGFLVHMGQTYPALKPYLKGVHATLESWRSGRDENGWVTKPPAGEETKVGPEAKSLSQGSRKRKPGTSAKAKSRARKRRKKGVQVPEVVPLRFADWDLEDPLSWEEKFGNFNLARFDSDDIMRPPLKVAPVKRLKDDLYALHELTHHEKPPRRLVRLGKFARAVYGFGDASKDGFGAFVEIQDHGVVWRSGVWKLSIRDESSNYREFKNLVESIETFVAKGTLKGHELFMFTDNSTAESAFFKGMSSSEKLFDLVLRLRKIEMAGELVIHLIHVAGTRMIWSGGDALSRGDHNAGVMTGEEMLSFVPLAKSASARSNELLSWVHSWAGAGGRQKVSVVPPTEWCGVHPEGGTFVWLPPPAAAATAVEWLGQSIHKRPNSTHIVLVPRLLTANWRKRLSKTSDILFTIPIGAKVWLDDNHEPLICAVCLPLSQSFPWSHRRSARVVDCEERLSGLWKTDFDATGYFLRKLLGEARSLGKV